MNKRFKILFLLFLLFSCKDKEQLCQEDRVLLGTQIFDGWIHLCNAIPSEQIDLKSKAVIELLGGSSISVRIYTDSIFLDTILFFDTRCGLVEDSPITFLIDSNGIDVGQYHSKSILDFSFGYQNCLNNSFFEGLAEQ